MRTPMSKLLGESVRLGRGVSETKVADRFQVRQQLESD